MNVVKAFAVVVEHVEEAGYCCCCYCYWFGAKAKIEILFASLFS